MGASLHFDAPPDLGRPYTNETTKRKANEGSGFSSSQIELYGFFLPPGCPCLHKDAFNQGRGDWERSTQCTSSPNYTKRAGLHLDPIESYRIQLKMGLPCGQGGPAGERGEWSSIPGQSKELPDARSRGCNFGPLLLNIQLNIRLLS